MSDESILTPENLNDMDPSAGISAVQDTLERFIATADVEAVFSKPIKQGDTLVIPTAEVLCGLGFGMGFGSGSGNNEDGSGTGVGGGGGGGGRVLSRPVAIIIVSPDGVDVEPIVDVTKIALAALTTGGFMLGMFMRMLKSGK